MAFKNKADLIAYQSEYYAANKEKVLAASKAYQQRVKDDPAFKEKRRAWGKARYHRLKNDPAFKEKQRANNQRAKNSPATQARKNDPAYKARERARSKAYQLAHPEVSRKAALRYKANHPDRVKFMEARYRREHGDRVKAASLSWRNRNLERAHANEKRWRLAHPEYTAAKTQKRWALKRTAKINLVAINQFIKSVKSKVHVTCYYCEKTILSKQCHFDHIVPLSKGGAHAIENLCVSCPSCNHSKHNKSVSAWVRVGQQVLSL